MPSPPGGTDGSMPILIDDGMGNLVPIGTLYNEDGVLLHNLPPVQESQEVEAIKHQHMMALERIKELETKNKEMGRTIIKLENSVGSGTKFNYFRVFCFDRRFTPRLMCVYH